MKINVIGLGKAGLPLAAVIADCGLTVDGIDIDSKRVEMINNGINPIPEENGLDELIKKHGGKNLLAKTAIEKSEEPAVFIVIVPLFIDENKKPQFSILKKAFESVGNNLKKKDIVVLETTVPVGTTEKFVKKILEEKSKLLAGIDFYLAYSPERIMTGHSISRFREFPKIIGGLNKESTNKAFEVYSIFAKPVKVKNSRTAELTKIAEGVYRDVNIALANELLLVSEKYDIDFWQVREAAKHQYCNILEPGNVGGHCIPVYPWFLINDNAVPLIKKARELNDEMIIYYLKKIQKIGGKKIGVIGLSYREGVKEKAYSRSIDMINILKSKKYDVYGYDPLYSKQETEDEFRIKFLEDFSRMDALIVMNKQDSLRQRLIGLKNKIVDVKNMLK